MKPEFLPVNWEHIYLRRLHNVCKSPVNEVFLFSEYKSVVCYILCHFLLHFVHNVRRLHCWQCEETSFCCSLPRFLFTSAVLHAFDVGNLRFWRENSDLRVGKKVYFSVNWGKYMDKHVLPLPFIVANSSFWRLPAETTAATLSDYHLLLYKVVLRDRTELAVSMLTSVESSAAQYINIFDTISHSVDEVGSFF